MPRLLRTRWPWFVLLLGALAQTGCKRGARGEPTDAAAEARAAANQRLVGTWVLVSFQPRESLEPMLASLLAAQFNALNVQFDGQRMVAQGVGVATERRYEIRDAQFNRFKLVAWDDKGVAYESLAEFRNDNELWFDSRTPPWHGTGVLRRR